MFQPSWEAQGASRWGPGGDLKQNPGRCPPPELREIYANRKRLYFGNLVFFGAWDANRWENSDGDTALSPELLPGRHHA
jgi:hypothetical protein